jgi:hypothetical protein
MLRAHDRRARNSFFLLETTSGCIISSAHDVMLSAGRNPSEGIKIWTIHGRISLSSVCRSNCLVSCNPVSSPSGALRRNLFAD